MSVEGYAAAGQSQRATMKQVAALASVGTKTVSRVINGEPNVTARTQQRVWDAVKALDYHVDIQAGNLRRTGGRTLTWGLLISSVDNPFAGAIYRSVEDLASSRHIAVIASSLDDDPERESLAVDAFLRRRVDGLILTTAARHQGYVDMLRDRGVPVVFVDRQPARHDVDAVVSDNRAGAATAARHLLAHGHRRFAVLTDRLAIQTATERAEGFVDECVAAGLEPDAVTVVSELHDAAASEAALSALLESEHPPTAVFAAQNLIGVGAVQALRGRHAQHRVALVSFDDFELADLVEPGISVVAQDPQTIGRIAADMLSARLDGDGGPARHVIVPTTFIARGSGEIPA